ncbi:MAG: calcium-translocating P-type ATPase, PMCA-type [Oscillospiraceae bacterium]|nr:calcium-translocating P-type ATPase, PMCA-type [Oscillospiraceae bacterium]
MKYYLEEKNKVYEELRSCENGITAEEALKRIGEDGKNKLAEGKKVSLFARFMSQLANPMIIILIVAAVISLITSIYANESFADVFIILFVVILNAILGVLQESKAEKAIEALKEMTAATCKVIRNGELLHIKTEDLAVGDVVLLEAGDSVPADVRIIESVGLKCDEAALTGESFPVEKTSDALVESDGRDVPLGDRKNMAYMGSVVVYGRGKAMVTATGMNTEMGKIADAITKAEDGETPLQIKLAQLSKILTYLVLGICVFIFAFSIIKAGDFSGAVILDTFMLAVSLAVAAIPEGLAAVVTIALSIGVTKMSKRNAIIRKLTAVETLGCTQIICSDKTGTLTQNKMTVVESYGEDEKLLATAMSVCNDSSYDSAGNLSGDPTETALVVFAENMGIIKKDIELRTPRVGEVPFDSIRKMMSTVHFDQGKYVQYTKGAPEELLKYCTHIIKDGRTVEITEEDRKEILEANKAMASKALRALGAAVKIYDAEPSEYSEQFLETGMTFVGIVGMIDPVRPEVIAAVKECNEAGIRAVMITGDHRDTAVAIAKQLGILEDESQAITGVDIDAMTDEEMYENVVRYSVYARVQPEHKVRIVEAWRKRGMITAMTGDGVNDAPAIKSADIGVGMGITGTDVTKNVADMVLADDNFATIVSAVEEGRRIYDNIRKAIQFLLSSNLSEVVSIFAATVMGFTILNPVHILWINLITDCLPALALSMEKGEPDLMKRKPRESKSGIFSEGVGADVAYQGLLITVVTLAAYFIGHFMESGRWEITNSSDGMTMAFLTMSMAEIFHSCNMRSQRGSIFKLHSHNMYLLGAMILSLVLTSAVIYIPVLSSMFEFESISFKEYIVALALAFSVLPIVEIVKLIQRACRKK